MYGAADGVAEQSLSVEGRLWCGGVIKWLETADAEKRSRAIVARATRGDPMLGGDVTTVKGSGSGATVRPARGPAERSVPQWRDHGSGSSTSQRSTYAPRASSWREHAPSSSSSPWWCSTGHESDLTELRVHAAHVRWC